MRQFLPIALALGLSAGPAGATTVVDVVDFAGLFTPGVMLDPTDPSRTFTHDISDDGFDPLTDVIGSAAVTLQLADDTLEDLFEPIILLVDPPFEFALISFGIIPVGLVEVDGSLTTLFEVTIPVGPGLLALMLQPDGVMTVTVQSLGEGDFWLVGSRLDARIVPAPPTLALAVLCLLAVRRARR